MSEEMIIWVEISFNMIYLLVVWGLVIAMQRNRGKVPPQDRRAADLVRWAFALLALGDTGHVGFRVIAYLQGGLETTVTLLGRDIGLVGLGALSTAITVTVFYILMLEVWRVRFDQQYGIFEYSLIGFAVLRFLLMIPAFNQWNSVVPPQPWSTIRNIPLGVLGLGTAFLILRDATGRRDRTFIWIGISILVSFACYIPVILFVQQVPMIGMLMIPKTLAYVAVGFLAYRELYGTGVKEYQRLAEEQTA